MDRATRRDQLKAKLRALVEQGGEGGRLPPERELSERFDVARETLRRALRELEAEGLLERKQGAGTFVSGQPVIKRPALMSFSEDMRARGLLPSSELLSCAAVAAGAKLAQKLKLVPGSPLWELQRLRLANDEPMALETVYLAQSRLPGLTAEQLAGQLASGSLYELLEQLSGVQIRSARQELQATVLNEDEAVQLEVPAFSPSLLVERITVSGKGEVIEYAKTLYRADRYRFELNVVRTADVDDAS